MDVVLRPLIVGFFRRVGYELAGYLLRWVFG